MISIKMKAIFAQEEKPEQEQQEHRNILLCGYCGLSAAVSGSSFTIFPINGG